MDWINIAQLESFIDDYLPKTIPSYDIEGEINDSWFEIHSFNRIIDQIKYTKFTCDNYIKIDNNTFDIKLDENGISISFLSLLGYFEKKILHEKNYTYKNLVESARKMGPAIKAVPEQEFEAHKELSIKSLEKISHLLQKFIGNNKN